MCVVTVLNVLTSVVVVVPSVSVAWMYHSTPVAVGKVSAGIVASCVVPETGIEFQLLSPDSRQKSVADCWTKVSSRQ